MAVNDMTTGINNLHIKSDIVHPLLNGNHSLDCETAEEVATTDSEEYLSEPLRYRNVPQSSSNDSSMTITQQNVSSLSDSNDNFYTCNEIIDPNNIQIPIVGYEIMEERARFTVFKLRVENKQTGDCWYVFRRYTDFVRLCNKLKHNYPHVAQHLPRKRWLGNNFDPVFLEERLIGLQALVNAILGEQKLIVMQQIQDFFCLNEPPVYSETNEESKAIFEALEETIADLKQQLREKEAIVDVLQDSLHSKTIENENLRKLLNSRQNFEQHNDEVGSNNAISKENQG